MRRFVLLPLLGLALVGCSEQPGTAVVGVVVDFQGDLVSVESFTVLTPDGTELELVPAADGDFAFPLPHLKEHLATGDPISVRYVEDGDLRVAVAIGDA
jgi:hypothetical protein